MPLTVVPAMADGASTPTTGAVATPDGASTPATGGVVYAAPNVAVAPAMGVSPATPPNAPAKSSAVAGEGSGSK